MKDADISELIQRARTGDSAAIVRLFEGYEKMLFNYIYRWTGNWHEAEDLTQEVFVKAMRDLEKRLSKMPRWSPRRSPLQSALEQYTQPSSSREVPVIFRAAAILSMLLALGLGAIHMQRSNEAAGAPGLTVELAYVRERIRQADKRWEKTHRRALGREEDRASRRSPPWRDRLSSLQNRVDKLKERMDSPVNPGGSGRLKEHQMEGTWS